MSFVGSSFPTIIKLNSGIRSAFGPVLGATLKSVIFVGLFSFSAAAADKPYPVAPHPTLTPGSLCDRPEEIRYPEHIEYCGRHVEPETKYKIIQTYDRELGYRVSKMNRRDFKIDHYIPLCAGGSNRADNLWPQHRSVYEVTDPLEFIACKKMKEGVLLQEEAVNLIRTGKNDLSKVDEILDYLHQL